MSYCVLLGKDCALFPNRTKFGTKLVYYVLNIWDTGFNLW